MAAAMSIEWLVYQLHRLGARQPPPSKPIARVPGATGVIRPGSASHATLALLRAHPGQWFRHGEIMRATRCTHAAVSWALVYLQAIGHVEAHPDEARNPRYLRYSATDHPKDDNHE